MPCEVLYVKVDPITFPSQLRALDAAEGLGEAELEEMVELPEAVAELLEAIAELPEAIAELLEKVTEPVGSPGVVVVLVEAGVLKTLDKLRELEELTSELEGVTMATELLGACLPPAHRILRSPYQFLGSLLLQ
jgi:hypothetical protein